MTVEQRCMCRQHRSSVGEPSDLMALAIYLLDAAERPCADTDHAHKLVGEARALILTAKIEADELLTELGVVIRDSVPSELTFGMVNPWGPPVPTGKWLKRGLANIVGADSE